jgi:hypothetical protein
MEAKKHISISDGKPAMKQPLEIPGQKWEDNTKTVVD